MANLFITLEGIDGSGKSTQQRLLAAFLRRRGYKVRTTREPGGTRLGERLRGILLASATRRLTARSELLLMYAARQQHLEEVVRPALSRGELVLSDRFNDASFAYQGAGRQLGARLVKALDKLVCGPTQPGLTILLDVPPRTGLQRARRRKQHDKHGRFESEGARFQERVRQAYLEIARREPSRVKVVKADRPPEEVQAEIREIISAFLSPRSQRMSGIAKGSRRLKRGPR